MLLEPASGTWPRGVSSSRVFPKCFTDNRFACPDAATGSRQCAVFTYVRAHTNSLRAHIHIWWIAPIIGAGPIYNWDYQYTATHA
jgi:hypothetical protein